MTPYGVSRYQGVNTSRSSQIYPNPFWITSSQMWHSLTHWGPVMHICISKQTNIGSDNGLVPCRRQAIIWTIGGILLIQTSGTNFSGTLSKIHKFSFGNVVCEMAANLAQPQCVDSHKNLKENMDYFLNQQCAFWWSWIDRWCALKAHWWLTRIWSCMHMGPAL